MINIACSHLNDQWPHTVSSLALTCTCKIVCAQCCITWKALKTVHKPSDCKSEPLSPSSLPPSSESSSSSSLPSASLPYLSPLESCSGSESESIQRKIIFSYLYRDFFKFLNPHLFINYNRDCTLLKSDTKDSS